MAWPINPALITLRVCADLDWKVTVSCPKCRYSTMIWPGKAPEALQAVPLERLFRQGAFRCQKPPCEKAKANSLTVDAMNVGRSEAVAKWE